MSVDGSISDEFTYYNEYEAYAVIVIAFTDSFADIKFDISSASAGSILVLSMDAPRKASNPEVKVEYWNGTDWDLAGHLPAKADIFIY